MVEVAGSVLERVQKCILQTYFPLHYNYELGTCQIENVLLFKSWYR